jgi:hypothetical protein
MCGNFVRGPHRHWQTATAGATAIKPERSRHYTCGDHQLRLSVKIDKEAVSGGNAMRRNRQSRCRTSGFRVHQAMELPICLYGALSRSAGTQTMLSLYRFCFNIVVNSDTNLPFFGSPNAFFRHLS